MQPSSKGALGQTDDDDVDSVNENSEPEDNDDQDDWMFKTFDKNKVK